MFYVLAFQEVVGWEQDAAKSLPSLVTKGSLLYEFV